MVILSANTGLWFPRVSGDGRSIACVENPVPNDDRGRVVLVGLDGKVRRLTQEFESVAGLCWSADGKEIFFTAATAGIHRSLWSVRPGRAARERLSAPTGLVVMDVAKNGDMLISRESIRNTVHARMAGDSAVRDVSWFDYSILDDLSPDGRVLLFDEESESAGPLYAACMRRAEDSGPVRLGNGIPVTLSPDGAWALSFVPSNPQQVVLLPTGPGQPRPLDLGPLSLVNIAGTWMPDGKHILVSAAKTGRPFGLWLLDVSGGPPKSVSPEGYSFGSRNNRRLSPDGRFVLCSSNEFPVGLFDLQAQVMKPLPGAIQDLRFIRWSADGRSVMAYARSSNPTPVYLIDVATGARRTLFELRRAPFETIRSVRVSDDLKSYAFTTGSLLHDLYLMRGLR